MVFLPKGHFDFFRKLSILTFLDFELNLMTENEVIGYNKTIISNLNTIWTNMRDHGVQ